MIIKLEVPGGTMWVEINAYLGADSKHPFGSECSKVYSGDEFQSLIAKEQEACGLCETSDILLCSRPYKRRVIDNEGNEDYGEWEYEPIEIKYCPNCGRKLRKDDEK